MIKGIEFTVRINHREYLLGSPIVVHLEIHNSGSKSVSVLDQLDPEFDIVKFDITKENEKFSFIPYTILDAKPLIVSTKSRHHIMV